MARARIRRALAALLGLAGLALPAFTAPGEGREGSAHAAAASTEQLDPNEVRAAYLYSFASRHVKWPDSSFKDKTAPLTIGILGTSPVEKFVRDTCKDRKAGDRSIVVRAFANVSEVKDCNLLFVPAGEEGKLKSVMETVAGRSVLVVVETVAAVEKSAHIALYLEKSKIRFAVNLASAAKEKFEISSELLKLAKRVDKQAERSAEGGR